MKISDKEACGLHSTLHTNNLVIQISFMGLSSMVGVGVMRMALENYILFHETRKKMQDCENKKHHEIPLEV